MSIESYLQDLDITWGEPSSVSTPLSLPPASGQRLDHLNNLSGLEAQSLLMLLPAERVQSFAVRSRHHQCLALTLRQWWWSSAPRKKKKQLQTNKNKKNKINFWNHSSSLGERGEMCVKLVNRFSSSRCQDAARCSAPAACVPACAHRLRTLTHASSCIERNRGGPEELPSK